MWNRYCQNHRSNLPNFLSFAWSDALDFNRQPCSNNKMYDDAVFADRFRYQLIMFGISVLIGLSRLLRSHIAYEIDTAKITATLFWISYCLNDLIRLNSIVRHIQTTKCTMIRISLIDSSINWMCLEFEYWQGYLDSVMLILHLKQMVPKSSQIVPNFLLFVWFDTVALNRLPCARARCTMLLFSMIHSDIN